MILYVRMEMHYFGIAWFVCLSVITGIPFPNKPCFSHVCSTSLLKTLRKGEIAGNKQFLLFPHCFLPVCRNFFYFDRI